MTAWLHSFGIAFQSVAQLFLLALIGWVAVRRGILTDSVIKALAALMIDLLIPALLFMAMLRGFDIAKLSQMTAMLGFSVFWIFAGFGLGWLGSRLWPRSGNGTDDRVVVAMTGIQNSFYLPMPLLVALLPADRLDEGMMYLGVAVIALSVLNWFFAPLLLASGDGAGGQGVDWAESARKILTNPPLIGLAAGCVAAQVPLLRDAAHGHAAGWTLAVRLPLDAIDLLVPCIAPLAMILLGAVLATHPFGEHHRWRTTLLVGSFRLLLVPALVLLIARHGFAANGVFLLVLMVEAASPPATNLSLIALRYGDQGGHVSSTLFTTYLLSLFTLPMWIGVSLVLFPLG